MVVTLNRETLLDVSVNVVPLGILLAFVVLFLVDVQWQGGAVALGISIALTVIPIVSLAALTYVAGTVIQSEEEGEDGGHA